MTTVSAQIKLIAPTRTVRLGDSLTVELLMSTRDTLTTTQFTLNWNPTVLSFGRVDTLAGFPQTADGDEFGLANLATGKLSFLWTANARIIGYVPKPDSLIFKVVFKAIGAHGTNSDISFTGTPTAMRASNPRYVNIPITAQNGRILIGSVGTKEENTEGVEYLQNAPNPFNNQTVINFKLADSDDVVVQIFDVQGRLVYTQKGFFAAGAHKIALNTEGVFPSGFYKLSLQTSRGIALKNIVKY